MHPIEISGHIYTQDDNGNWTFKAKESEPLKQDGTLKAQYKELPQFNIIYDIEAHMQGQMDNEIKAATKEILNILK